jgi:hypothetical protein
MIRRSMLALFAAAVLPLVAYGADGTIKITFKLDGKAPTPEKLTVDKDVGFCGPKMLVDESLKVGSDGGVQNIAMYMFTTATKKAPANQAALEALAKEVKVDNVGCRYEPRLTVMHTSQTLVIGNPDPIGHNTKGDLFSNTPFNELIPAGGSVKKTFSKRESRPMPLACSIHPWMSGFLLIQDHPYFGVSNDKGEITINNVPAGSYTFVLWHERPGYITKATKGGKAVEWKQGKIDVKVAAGENDLGEYTLSLDTFKKK